MNNPLIYVKCPCCSNYFEAALLVKEINLLQVGKLQSIKRRKTLKRKIKNEIEESYSGKQNNQGNEEKRNKNYSSSMSRRESLDGYDQFKCMQCAKSFNHQSSLRRHEKERHNLPPRWKKLISKKAQKLNTEEIKLEKNIQQSKQDNDQISSSPSVEQNPSTVSGDHDQQESNSDEIGVHKCQQCRKIYSLKGSLKRHIIEKHQNLGKRRND